MKKLIFLFVFTVAAFTLTNAQVVFDWEEISPEITTWDWVPEIIENPVMEGLNTSNFVAGGAVSGGEWDGFVIDLPDSVQFTYSRDFTMLVYAEAEGIVGMKLEATDAYPEIIVWADYTTPLAWEKVTFTFAEDAPVNEFSRAAIFVNHGQGNEGTLWYCDDLIGPDEEIVESVKETINITEASIYPNPFIDQLHIESSATISEIDLYNLTGQNMMSVESINSSSLKLETSVLVKGIYFIKIKDTDGVVSTLKLIKN